MKVNGKYRCLTRLPDNFFEGRNLGKVSFPLRVRLTSITGQQVETTIPRLQNGVNFQSNVQYKGIKSGSKLTKDRLMSETIALHLCLNSLYFSSPSSAKQQREMTKF